MKVYKLLILKFLIILNFNSFSQEHYADSLISNNSFFVFKPKDSYKFVFGFETSGTIVSIRDSVTQNFNRSSAINWEPHFSYYFNRNIGIGVLSKIEHFQSNHLQTDPTKLEYGFFVRKFLPFNINRSFFDNISYSLEFSFSRANYYHKNKLNEANYINGFNQSVIRIPLIVSVRIFHGLNMRFSYRYVNYLTKFDRSELSFGFEYQFIKK